MPWKSRGLGKGTKNQFLSGPGDFTRASPLVGQNLNSTMTLPTPRFGNRTSQGPRILGLGRPVPQLTGPGDPPEGFVGGTTSLSEWYLYWAFSVILGPEGLDWSYQSGMLGSRNTPGGAVVDYVVYQGSVSLLVRLQTYRFHLSAPADQQVHDIEQFIALSSPDTIVIDVYEDQFLFDETGQAAIKLVVDIINRRIVQNPMASGFVVGTG